MARAKRTDRAEARRRHRSEQALAGVDDAALDAPEVEATTPARPAPGATTAVRPGFATAFREAFRPLDIRADLRALPSLVRHRALWIPVLLTIAQRLALRRRPARREPGHGSVRTRPAG